MTEKDADKLERWLLGETALARTTGRKLLDSALADRSILRQRHHLLMPALLAAKTPAEDWEDIGLRVRA
jgi:hypothetical protein